MVSDLPKSIVIVVCFFLSVLFARWCFDFAIDVLHKLDTCSPDFGFELVSGNSREMKAKQ